MTVGAIVPAAGAGRRLGGSARKPFVALGGRPLLAYALDVLQRSPAVGWIVVVAQPADHGRVRALLKAFRITKALPVCAGGASRAESVARGAAVLPGDAEWVLVHDAARPCVSPGLIAAAAAAAKRHGAAVCGIPASLTVKAADPSGEVRLTLDREHLWFIQTPQVFRRDWFTDALAKAGGRLEQFPDDASVVESAGFPVRIVPGDPLNLKVTTRDDLLLAEAILQHRNGRSDVRGQKAEVRTRKEQAVV